MFPSKMQYIRVTFDPLRYRYRIFLSSSSVIFTLIRYLIYIKISLTCKICFFRIFIKIRATKIPSKTTRKQFNGGILFHFLPK